MNPTPESPYAAGSETSLTRRELFSLLALGLAIAAGCALLAFWSGRPAAPSQVLAKRLDPPRRLSPFQLTERSGRVVTEADLAGKFLVVNFAFTGCSLACLAVNDRMAEIQRLVAAESQVLLLSLSVDPVTDTPPVLTQFANRFGADANRWLFLTGEREVLYRLLEASFLSRSPELTGLVPGGFAHTDEIMLVDPAGQVWASFNGLKTNIAAAVVAEIAKRRASR